MAIRYLLDTNICIYIAKHNPAKVRTRFEQLPADALAMSVITLGELQHGAEKARPVRKPWPHCTNCRASSRSCR